MDSKKSFWETVPGILTAIGGTIAAAATLLTALYTTGLIGNKAVPTPTPLTTTQSPIPLAQSASPGREVAKAEAPSPENRTATVTSSSGPPRSFYLDSVDPPGKDVWARLGEDTWIERYPDGRTNEFRHAGRLINNNCIGSLLYRITFTDLEVFIPDRDCSAKQLQWRHKKAEWHYLGEMRDIQ